MTDTTTQDDQDLSQDDDDNTNDTTDTTSGSLGKETEEVIEKIVNQRLKKMKDNVDKAYKDKETLTKELARLKSAAAASERKSLEDSGKHLEAARLKVAELEEIVNAQREQITKLSRDSILDKALSALPFRNESARMAATRQIIDSLVQDDDETWVHRSGATLKDYISAFAKDSENEFFFKPRENTGAGSGGNKTTSKERPKSLAGLSTEELLKAAAEGRLGSYPTL